MRVRGGIEQAAVTRHPNTAIARTFDIDPKASAALVTARCRRRFTVGNGAAYYPSEEDS
jgi:hypothetical protein